MSPRFFITNLAISAASIAAFWISGGLESPSNWQGKTELFAGLIGAHAMILVIFPLMCTFSRLFAPADYIVRAEKYPLNPVNHLTIRTKFTWRYTD